MSVGVSQMGKLTKQWSVTWVENAQQTTKKKFASYDNMQENISLLYLE